VGGDALNTMKYCWSLKFSAGKLYKPPFNLNLAVLADVMGLEVMELQI
jgi:hypothetical protein